MKRLRRPAAVALVLLAALALWLVLSARPSEGVRFAMMLGPGWNLANTLDAHGLGAGAGAPETYDAYWGAEPPSPALMQAIAAAGFHTLRIPVTWYEHIDGQGRIDPVWLDHVQGTVDWALAAGLHVVINAHHDAWYQPAPETLPAAKAALCSLWAQLCARFADYDERLLFESMNEPRLIGSAEEWIGGTPEARACVNALNAAFVDTVRASGGHNASRWLLLPAYAAGVQEDALPSLTLPQDPRIMVSVHLYLPYAFALDTAGTADWSPASADDTEALQAAFQRLWRLFVSRGIPVVVTEFGAVDKGNEAARAAWAGYVLHLAGQNRIPCLWWDTALLAHGTHAWRYPALLTALTR